MDLLEFASKCGASTLKATATSAGVFGASIVVGMVATAVSAVLSATHLLVTGVREIWDSIASFGGDSDAFYDIRIKGTASAPCAASALFNAAAKKEGIDRNDPGYGPSPGGIAIKPEAIDAYCSANWATALISRPNVGTTDGLTLFKYSSGSGWTEEAQLGFSESEQKFKSLLASRGVPAQVAEKFATHRY